MKKIKSIIKHKNIEYLSTHGITLVTLVVTIVIIIILAGISLNLTIGENGLFTMAKKAKENIELAQIEEQTRMNELYDEMEQGGYYENPAVDELEGTIENLNKTIEDLKGQLENEKQQKASLEQQVENLNTQLESEQQKKTELEGELNDLETQLGSANSQLQELRSQITQKDTEIGNLNGQLESKTTELENKNKTITSLEASKKQLEEQVKKLETEVANLKEQLKNVQEKEESVNMVQVGNDSIPVPKGFYYVGGTKESGVVISDDSRDENKYKDVTDGNVPPGVVYNTATGIPKTEKELTESEKQQVIFGNQFVWIPVTEQNYKKTSWGSTYQNAIWETQTNTAELIQIKKYGGFYVGRYEAGTSNIKLSNNANFAGANTTSSYWSNNNFSIQNGTITAEGNITCKAGEIPYYHADYFTALKLCNRMYEKSKYVQSGLITGTMWDVTLNFIANGNISIVTTQSYWGNYNVSNNTNVKYIAGQGRYAAVNYDNGSNSAFTKSDANFHYGIRTTASTENVKKKNLYDISGNLWEWTQEVAYRNNTLECYMLRGGSLHNSYSTCPACIRTGETATGDGTHYGFRPALYIM